MVFTEIIFLFFFLPFTLLAYFIVPRRLRNFVLLPLSLFFYAWGEAGFVFLMILSILGNYAVGLLIDYFREKKSLARVFLLLGVLLNLGFLGYYKYVSFLEDNLNALVSQPMLNIGEIHLPIGISFFTFQAMSYVIDVYWKTANVQRNPFKLGLYIALFPQLIAGPIVRYHDIDHQLSHRVVTLDGFTQGIYRFVLGLGKKVLIANTLAVVVDEVFATELGELGSVLAWFTIICYALQIYFDFSGYSDMAIGLGMMFGFTFPENFNFPYTARSIQDFWQRWHISASTWFRLYLFSPLSRSMLRKWGVAQRLPIQIFSTLITMLLIGLWHGASWNFVIWGGIFGVFLVIEQSGFRRNLQKWWRPLQHIYTLLIVLLAWVFFRAETMDEALTYLVRMFSFSPENPAFAIHRFIDREIVWTLILGVLLSTSLIPNTLDWVERRTKERRVLASALENVVAPLMRLGTVAAILFLSILYISAGVYSPFIYFRF